MQGLSKIRILLTILLVLFGAGVQHAQSKPSSDGRDQVRPNRKAAKARVYGGGSTVIYPLLSTWIDEYTRLHPEVRIFYQAVGSGAGVHLLIKNKYSFAVTNWPISNDEIALAKGPILDLPVALNAVVPVYNLAQVRLRFSGTTLADIFLGKITKWDDPAIASDNPGVNLPEMDIKVAHHFPNDGQIDTVIMAEYLSKVSTAFKATLANPSSASWPAENVSAGYIKGAGLIGFVAETPGSIGYVELERARHSPLTYGAVKNSDGDFVTASQESLTAASALVSPMIQTRMDFRISLTNAPGKKSYPIASFMWLLLYEDSKEEKKNEIMKDFLKWVLTDGQKLALKLGYPALPDDLTKVELQRLGASTRP